MTKQRKLISSIFIVMFISLILIGIKNTLADEHQEFQGTGCTNFAVSIGDTVLFGNSEDASGDHPLMQDPEGSYIFVYPNSSAGYGCVFLGWYWQDIYVSVQGGMNEEGLCYDSTAIPDTPMNPHSEKPYKMGEDWLSGRVLRECSNVSEAIEIVKLFDFESLWFQLFLTDANGDSVIISPGLDGEIAVTYQDEETGYLAQTNFNRVIPESHFGSYPCERYETAVDLLDKIEIEENVTVSYFEEILDAVHVESFQGYTAYSNICNPKNRMMYIYFAAQFDEMISFNITEELDKGERSIKITDLLSEETVVKGVELYEKYRNQYALIIVSASIGAFLVIVGCIVAIVILIRRKKRKKLFKEVIGETSKIM